MNIKPYFGQPIEYIQRNEFDWAKENIERVIENATIASASFYVEAEKTIKNYFTQKLENYILFHGSETYFAKDYKTHTSQTFSVRDELTGTVTEREYSIPIPIRNINNIKPIILQIYGEQIARPFTFSVQNTSSNATKLKDEFYLISAIELLNAKLQQDLINSGLPFKNEEEIKAKLASLPTNLEEIGKMPYKDKYAYAMQALLEYYYYNYSIKEITDLGFLDYLIFNEEIYLINLENRRSPIQKISPLNCRYDNQYNLTNKSDPSWFVCWDFLDINECISRFNLTDEQVYTLETQLNENVLYNPNSILDANLYQLYDQTYLSGKFLVYYVMWKSIRGFETVKDKNGNYVIKDFDKYHEKQFKQAIKNPNAKKETVHYQQAWQAVKIGADTYVDIKPIKAQPRDSKNLKSVQLPVAICKSEGRSLVEDMRNIDFLLKLCWHKVEYLLSQAKGKILAVDLAFIPRQYNYDIDQVVYHLKTMGLFLYNSREDGQINNGGNMIHELDLSISNTLGQVIQLIQALEKKLYDISGVNEQRMAQMQGRDNLGTTKMAMQQSILRTEFLYRAHALSLKNLLTILCDYAKEYHKEPFDAIYHIIGEANERVLKIMPNDLLANYSIFINDTTKETEVINSIKQLAQFFIQQNMIDITQYIAILESESLSIAKAKLAVEIERKKLEAQQASKQQHEYEQQLLQAKQQHEIALMEKQLQSNKETTQIAEQTELTKEIERIKLEQEKIRLQAEKLQTEREKLQQELNHKTYELEMQQKLREKELESELTLEELKRNTELQKLELQHRLDALMQEAEINAKKELEYAKIKKEYDQMMLNIQNQQRDFLTQTQQQKLDFEYQLRLRELDAEKQRIANYEKRLAQDTNEIKAYIQRIETQNQKLEQELDKLKQENLMEKIKQIKMEIKNPIDEILQPSKKTTIAEYEQQLNKQ